jgi:hypothetical protein
MKFRSGTLKWTGSVLPIAFLFAGSASSQASFTPPAGDADVFYRYLREVHAALVAPRQASPEAAQRRAAGLMHAEVSDLPALETAYQNATSAISSLQVEVQRYLDDCVKKEEKPDQAKLAVYEDRRVQLLRQTDQQLRNALGEPAWLHLRAFIDGEFRSHVRRRGIPWPSKQ